MKKTLLLACLLASPALCAAPGLTITACSLSQEVVADPSLEGGLRGSMTLRNDFGEELTHLNVTIHILDGYGRPIFDHPGGEIARLKQGQSETLPIYRGFYAGSVAIFQLSADVDAQSAAGPQHFVLPPHNAATYNAPLYRPGY